MSNEIRKAFEADNPSFINGRKFMIDSYIMERTGETDHDLTNRWIGFRRAYAMQQERIDELVDLKSYEYINIERLVKATYETGRAPGNGGSMEFSHAKIADLVNCLTQFVVNEMNNDKK